MKKKKSINLTGLDQLLKADSSIIVIDVRSEEEYKEKHIPFAINLSQSALSFLSGNLFSYRQWYQQSHSTLTSRHPCHFILPL